MAQDNLHPFLGLAIIVAFAWLGYGEFMRVANRFARVAVEALEPQETPFINAIRIAVMPFWGGLLLIAYLLIALVVNLPVQSLFGKQFDWTVIPRGILLGMAEGSFTMLIATVAFRVLAPLRQRQRGGDAALEYQTIGQGGWMRSYRDAFERLPSPLAYAVVTLPLLGEELIFRAVGIPVLLPLGIAPAVAVSTILFMAVQLLRLPSWYQAVGPVCGALVMGVCHGFLFAVQGNLLLPLIAHVTFLVFFMGRKSLRQGT
jgi:hypothetical protein